MSSGKSGQIIVGKSFQMQVICRCKNKCSQKIGLDRQLEIFTTYYDFSNWMNKTIFIRGSVSRDKVKNKESVLQPIAPLKHKDFSYKYKLKDSDGIEHQVCKHFFLKCLQISSARVYRAIHSAIKNPSAIDKRGKQTPANKTPETDKQYLNKFIKKFPAYESHYGRRKSSKKYLASNLNIIRMYREYVLKCEFSNRTPLTEHMFRTIFNTEHNLEFKRPATDVCITCKEFEIKLANPNVTFNDKCILENLQLIHWNAVEKKLQGFHKYIEEAKNSNEAVQVFTMDLQKTLETPLLNVSVAYYKRSLWTYNFCIYNESEKKGFMYIWHEANASRGADEISSCVKIHIEKYVSEKTKKIIIFSDACGGQNKNIKTTLMLKKILCGNKTVEEIQQHFFLSGHSRNACDRAFALIERQRKITEDIFVPDHWYNLISQSKKTEPKFVVNKMQCIDFYSSDELKKLIVNRKKSINNKKINWHDIDTIINRQNDPFSLYVKLKEDSSVHKIDLQKKNVTKVMFSDIALLHTSKNGREITKEKHDDLMSLLKFIPPKYHRFYQNLRGAEEVEDYGLASESSSESENEEEDE